MSFSLNAFFPQVVNILLDQLGYEFRMPLFFLKEDTTRQANRVGVCFNVPMHFDLKMHRHKCLLDTTPYSADTLANRDLLLRRTEAFALGTPSPGRSIARELLR